MNSMLKIGGTLFGFTAIAALLLAGTNEMTAPVIKQRNELASNQARQQVLNTAKDFEQLSPSDYSGVSAPDVKEVFAGKDGNEVVGYTIKSEPTGYGGPIELTIGISKDGKITGVNVGNNQETPGLGAKSQDPAFNGQYKGKEAKELEVIKSGSPGPNQIKAISGATITSKAVTKGVNEAIQVFDKVNK